MSKPKFDIEKMKALTMQQLRDEFEQIPVLYDSSVIETEEIMVSMSDGIRLKTYITRPKNLPKGPVLFTRSCYPHNFETDMLKSHEFARRGLICVFQYCRGTGGSEGLWEPNVHERPDGIDAINWLAAQDWAERIGYYGASYLALTGWAWIDVAPEKVKGMYLSVYGTNRYASAYNDGLFRQDILTAWAKGNAGVPISADHIESCKYMPQVKVDEELWGITLPWYKEMISNTNYSDEYWQTGFWHTLRDIPSKVKIPIVFEEGWYDHHLGSALSGYRTMTGIGLDKCLLRIGPWDHGKQTVLDGHTCKNAASNQITDIYNFFKAVLLDQVEPESGVQLYVAGEDRWINEKNWPEPTEIKKLYFNAQDRALESHIQDKATDCTFIYDPQNPVMSYGEESTFASWGANGSRKMPKENYRDDVISFVSEPLSKDLPIVGKINADLYVSSDAEDTAFSIKIMEVFENGDAYNIRSGITTLAYRGHTQNRQTYTPNQIVPVNVDTWDIAWTIKKGSRIRVDISSSNFPQYNIHSNYPGVWALQEKCKTAKQTIYSGKDHPSVLNIPVCR